MFVLQIVMQIIKLQAKRAILEDEVADEAKIGDTEGVKFASKREKNITSLIFVILEICIRDLIKYLPNLLASEPSSQSTFINRQKSSFLYMHITACKQLSKKDVELLAAIMNILNELPFQPDITLESNLDYFSIFECFLIEIFALNFHRFIYL